MKFPARIALTLLGALALAASAFAIEEPQRLWDEAKTSLKQGAYRDALQSLEVILTLTPDDPWAQLYGSLCRLRLEATSPFAPVSLAQLEALKTRLRDEERSQRRTSAQLKTLERQVRREQARWDQELQALERSAQREVKARREREEAARLAEQVERARQAVQGARAEQLARREQAKAEAVREAQVRPVAAEAQAARLPGPPQGPPAPATRPDVAGSEQPSAIEPASPGGPSVSGPAVELAPVVVPTAVASEESVAEPIGVTPPGVEPMAPSLVGRALPPAGAVQINARQMSVSPERKMAFAEGDVEAVYETTILTCDRLTLFTDTKDVYPEGRVRMEEGNQVFRGELAHYNFETKKGRFLQGTITSPPWHEHGRSVEHLAEGVYQVTPGYLTSCELEPPHFKFYGRRAIVFADDKIARARNVSLVVEKVPFLYLPWLSVADRQSPFFLIPGKKKPWEQFALMGYRYELSGGHRGALRLDWRRTFGWAIGVDHQMDLERFGKGLIKLYYNEEQNRRRMRSELPRGADVNRYRAMWRHRWLPMEDTVVTVDLQEFSDTDFRRELLFREEFTKEDHSDSFVSVVTNTEAYSLSAQVRKRLNRFQTVTEAFPTFSLSTRSQPIGQTGFFGSSSVAFSNLQTKNAHSEVDSDVVKVDWSQGFNYALRWFRPIEVTPNVGVTQTYYTKDKQGGDERPQGKRDLISGQASAGVDSSLKLFRIFPVTTNVLGLDIHWLRHVLTPTLRYMYSHRPTVPNDVLFAGSGAAPVNRLTLGIENKLQTKRVRDPKSKKLSSVDLLRFLIEVPYLFHGQHNKQGGRLGGWAFDLELYPSPWMRFETNWSYPSHFLKGSQDERVTGWGTDLVVVGGEGVRDAKVVPSGRQDPTIVGQYQRYQPGARGGLAFILPKGQWFFGWRHSYSYNDKTEETVEFNYRPSEKWEIGTFHRVTMKEVVAGTKRFNNIREYQYSLRRDLHDWIAELAYRVDREFGEELFFILTLKAYPELPIEVGESYHQPKLGSQSSPFSPVPRQ